MKNIELNAMSRVVNQLVQRPLYGRLKFKILKLFKETNHHMDILREAVSGIDSDSAEFEEIMQTEISANFETRLTEVELENIELSALDLFALGPILEEENNGNQA